MPSREPGVPLRQPEIRPNKQLEPLPGLPPELPSLPERGTEPKQKPQPKPDEEEILIIGHAA
jgi:hypothetical protein